MDDTTHFPFADIFAEAVEKLHLGAPRIAHSYRNALDRGSYLQR